MKHLLSARRGWQAVSLLGLGATLAGCYAIRNGWLDPTTLGDFRHTRDNEIRASLTIEDAPTGIAGAQEPTEEDMTILPREYEISPGDTLAVEIDQLRTPGEIYTTPGIIVDEVGQLNLPVVGRVQAAGLTPRELEGELAQTLRDRGVLMNPQVTVNALFLQNATYSIFGIGVSAANNAPLRAGTFPLRRPNMRVLEAINNVGGLNEFVTEVYVFRTEPPPRTPREPAPGPEPQPAPEPPQQPPHAPGDTLGAPPTGAQEELLEAVEPPAQPEPEVPQELEAAPPDQWLWLNDEYVINPAYKQQMEEQTPGTDIPMFEPTAPAVNWAQIAGEVSYRIIRISADALRSGDPESNIYVRGGDTIRIVSGEIGVYYVMGQVVRPGPFAFNAEPITLKGAIAAAGGLAPLAWPDRCTIYRRIGQREQMVQVNLDRIFAGKDPDFFIRRGDIVNVGTHPVAPFLQRIRALTLPTPVNNVGYSFTYARNYADIDSFAAQQNPANVPETFPNLFP